MKRLLACVSSLVLVACAEGAGHDAGSASSAAASSSALAPQPVFAGKKTSELALRPEVLEAALALSRAKAYESKYVGYGGSPSATYALFETLRGLANERELIALLEHESAIVRAYVGVHVASKVAAGLPALTALAEDDSPLSTLQGCIGGGSSVSMLVVEALCTSPLEGAPKALLAIHARGGAMAADALACAAPFAVKQATAAALEGLRASPKPMQQEAYLRVLAVAPAPAEVQCPLALQAAASDNASVVIAAAMALSHCDDAPTKQRLSELVAGKNVVVARQARASQLLQTLEQFRPADGEAMHEIAMRLAQALAGAETAAAWLPLATKLIELHPKELTSTLSGARVLPETSELVVRLLAKTAPAAELSAQSPRVPLLTYLVRSQHPSALPELRRSLKANNREELAAAIRGLAALRDKTSKPAIEQFSKHDSPLVAQAAREALLELER